MNGRSTLPIGGASCARCTPTHGTEPGDWRRDLRLTSGSAPAVIGQDAQELWIDGCGWGFACYHVVRNELGQITHQGRAGCGTPSSSKEPEPTAPAASVSAGAPGAVDNVWTRASLAPCRCRDQGLSTLPVPSRPVWDHHHSTHFIFALPSGTIDHDGRQQPGRVRMLPHDAGNHAQAFDSRTLARIEAGVIQ